MDRVLCICGRHVRGKIDFTTSCDDPYASHRFDPLVRTDFVRILAIYQTRAGRSILIQRRWNISESLRWFIKALLTIALSRGTRTTVRCHSYAIS